MRQENKKTFISIRLQPLESRVWIRSDFKSFFFVAGGSTGFRFWQSSRDLGSARSLRISG